MTTLLELCKNNDSAKVLKLLTFYHNFDIDQIDDMSFTALIWACFNKMSDVALEILKYPTKCKLDQVNNKGNTSLIWACFNKMSDVALEILKYPDKCKLDQVNSAGATALILACFNKMSDVALEILKYHDKFNIRHKNNNGQTALMIAYIYKLQDVIDAIYEYHSVDDILNLTDCEKKTFNHYAKKQTTEQMNKLLSLEDIEKRHAYIDMIENKIKNLAKNGECIICYDNTNNNIFLTKCKHMLHICNDCYCTINNKCPICMIPSEIINGCYYI